MATWPRDSYVGPAVDCISDQVARCTLLQAVAPRLDPMGDYLSAGRRYVYWTGRWSLDRTKRIFGRTVSRVRSNKTDVQMFR